MSDEKPRIRVQAGSAPTTDSFANLTARLGVNGSNQSGGASYQFNFLTRNRALLEAAYRGSWIVAAACDHSADDMTRAGIKIKCAGLAGEEIDLLNAAIRDLQISEAMADTIRWGRLFGGAVAVPMLDGQDPSYPLDVGTVRKGAFRGLMVMDRYLVNPNQAVVTEFGPNFGLPDSYDLVAQVTTGVPRMRIHHTRAFRQVGYGLPFYQRWTENLWGESVIERIWDRIVSFDSTTAGAAQLVFKAHLRTMKVENLRTLMAAGAGKGPAGPGGDPLAGLMNTFSMIRQFQTNEGMSVIDAKDELQVDTYNFSGLDRILEMQGLQVCAAVEEPYTRLFGDSPSGMNSTGESDLTTYYDNNLKKQETKLRPTWTVVLDILCRSVLGKAAPPGFTFEFNPLRTVKAKEQADIAAAVGQAVTSAAQLTGKRVALESLRATSDETGLWGTITDDDIADAKDEDDAPAPDAMGAMGNDEGQGNESGDDQASGNRSAAAKPGARATTLKIVHAAG